MARGDPTAGPLPGKAQNPPSAGSLDLSEISDYPPSEPTSYPPPSSSTTYYQSEPVSYPPATTEYPPFEPTPYPPTTTNPAHCQPEEPVSYPPATTQYSPSESTPYPPTTTTTNPVSCQPKEPVSYPPATTQYPPSEPTAYPPAPAPTTKNPTYCQPEEPVSYPPSTTRYPQSEPRTKPPPPSKPKDYSLGGPAAKPAATGQFPQFEPIPYPPRQSQPTAYTPPTGSRTPPSQPRPESHPPWRPTTPPPQFRSQLKPIIRPQDEPRPAATVTPISYQVPAPQVTPSSGQWSPPHRKQPPGPTGGLWNTGLFDCFSDPTNALITWCVPCVTFGQIAEIIKEGGQSCAGGAAVYCALTFTGLACLYSCSYRKELRTKYNLNEEPMPDCLAHCLCGPCALCQEYRELKARGFDPDIGWQGDSSRPSQTYKKPPPRQTIY